jgi:hypothetical protein
MPEVDVEPKIREFPILGDYEIGGITATQGSGLARITLKRNIISGTYHHAFHFKPKPCTGSTAELNDFVFEDNVAHSISGYGAVAANTNHRCVEVEKFVAYKCTEASIMLGGSASGTGSNNVGNIGRELISIDSRYGIAVHSGGDGNAELIDSKVYGEVWANRDCPPGSPCDHCLDTTGIILNCACSGAHLDYQKKWFKHPLFKACNSGMLGTMTYKDVEFINFNTTAKTCGAKTVGFRPWPKASDYTAYAKFERPKFTNSNNLDALTFIRTPP